MSQFEWHFELLQMALGYFFLFNIVLLTNVIGYGIELLCVYVHI